MKGLFYSIMIALFIMPILALILFYSQTAIPQNIATKIRADELQYFSESIKEDLARFLQINGKRAMVAAVNASMSNGIGLDNASLRLIEVIENGTLYGNQTFADQKNFSEWKKSIRDIALKSGFDINLTLMSLDVIQNDSFSILFSTTVYINISDNRAEMSILKNMSIAEAISIENIQDPLYQIKTNGTIFRTIKKSPFSKILDPPTNLSNLTFNVINKYYYSSISGPSFLNRLEGKTTSSAYGLESFIYLPEHESPNPSLSVLDYEYWKNIPGYLLNSSKTYDPPLDSIYNWLKISCQAATDYNLNSTLNTAC
jgi:hypothetical protein